MIGTREKQYTNNFGQVMSPWSSLSNKKTFDLNNCPGKSSIIYIHKKPNREPKVILLITGWYPVLK